MAASLHQRPRTAGPTRCSRRAYGCRVGSLRLLGAPRVDEPPPRFRRRPDCPSPDPDRPGEGKLRGRESGEGSASAEASRSQSSGATARDAPGFPSGVFGPHEGARTSARGGRRWPPPRWRLWRRWTRPGARANVKPLCVSRDGGARLTRYLGIPLAAEAAEDRPAPAPRRGLTRSATGAPGAPGPTGAAGPPRGRRRRAPRAHHRLNVSGALRGSSQLDLAEPVGRDPPRPLLDLRVERPDVFPGSRDLPGAPLDLSLRTAAARSGKRTPGPRTSARIESAATSADPDSASHRTPTPPPHGADSTASSSATSSSVQPVRLVEAGPASESRRRTPEAPSAPGAGRPPWRRRRGLSPPAPSVGAHDPFSTASRILSPERRPRQRPDPLGPRARASARSGPASLRAATRGAAARRGARAPARAGSSSDRPSSTASTRPIRWTSRATSSAASRSAGTT